MVARWWAAEELRRPGLAGAAGGVARLNPLARWAGLLAGGATTPMSDRIDTSGRRVRVSDPPLNEDGYGTGGDDSGTGAGPRDPPPHRWPCGPAAGARNLLDRARHHDAAPHHSRVRPARCSPASGSRATARPGSTPGSGDTIVLTSSPHCAGVGTTAASPDGTVQGVFGPTARDATCAYPDHTCAASDMNYLVVAPDRIPWGHLNEIDLGVGGYRILAPDAEPLACADIAVGDPIEMDGRGVYRTGTVAEKGAYLHPPAQDGSYFPCMIASRLSVGPRRLRQRGARAGAAGGDHLAQPWRQPRVHASRRGPGRAGPRPLHHA